MKLRKMSQVAAMVALLATSAAALPASARRVTPSQRGDQRVYVANRDCHGHAYRPNTITLACGDDRLYATVMSYLGNDYGEPHAAAAASFYLHHCGRGCPFSWYTGGPGALTLRRVVSCKDGRLYYSRARYAFPARSVGIFPSAAGNEVDIEPYERCHVVNPAHHDESGAARPATTDGSASGSAGAGLPATDISPSERALIATQAAESTLQLASPPPGATKLNALPAGAPKWLEPGETRNLDRAFSTEERVHLVERSALWATATPPEELARYIDAHLPHPESSSIGTSGGSFTPPHGHETLAEIIRRESATDWTDELQLPTGSSVLRLRVLGVFIERNPAGGFYVRVTAGAMWEPPRPSYSLLGNSARFATITVVHPRADRRHAPIVVSRASGVAALVEAINALPVAEDTGAGFHCPAFGAGEVQPVLLVRFRERAGGPVIATFQDRPSACPEDVSIAVPGRAPVALSEARQLPRRLEQIIAVRLRGL